MERDGGRCVLCWVWLWLGVAVFVLGSVGTDAASTIGFSSAFTDAANPFSVAECDPSCTSPGSVSMNLILTRSGDLSSTASVAVSTRAPTTAGTTAATAGVDYTPLMGVTATFAINQAQQTVSVTIISDVVYEPDEQFEAYLTNPSSGVTLDSAASTAYVVIQDGGDVGIFTFSAPNYTFIENAGTVRVKIVRYGGTSGTAAVAYALTNPMQATATVNKNFKMLNSSYVNFAAGQTEGYIYIELINDDVYEANEYFYIGISSVSSPGEIGSTPTTVVFIADDGDAGQFNFAVPYIFCREDSGNAVVTIERDLGSSSASYVPVTLVVTTVNADSNATQGGSQAFDYLGVSQQLTWATGQVNQTFSVKVFNNNRYQSASRAIKVRLDSVAGGASIGTQSKMWIYIIDDRDAGTLSFEVSHYEVLENAGRVTVKVTRSGIPDPTNVNTYSDGIVNVDIATYGGTIVPGKAKYDADYDYGVVQARGCTHISPCTADASTAYTPIQTTTLTFANQEVSKTVDITILNNNFFLAPNQVFKVALNNVRGGAHLGVDYEHPIEWSWYHSEFLALEPRVDLLLDNVGTIVTIQDDGDPAIVVTKASLSVSEIGQVDSFRVRLNSPPTSTVNIQLGFNAAELSLSPSALSFTTTNWNQYQPVGVQSIPDNSADGIHSSMITITPFSSDPMYGLPLRTLASSTGFTLATGIYTQIWGTYDTGNPGHAFPWQESSGVLTSPAQQSSITAFILDDDQPMIILTPEVVRYQTASNGPRNFVSIRESGHSASVGVTLASMPHADVQVSFAADSSSALVVTPNALQFSSANWQSTQYITVSATTPSNATEVQLHKVLVYSSSSGDGGYNHGSASVASIFVSRFPPATVVLDSSLVTAQENGGAGATVAYDLHLGSEPMHWEPVTGAYTPYQITLQANADTTLNFSASAPGNLGSSTTLSVAGNSSQSTTESAVSYIASVRFSTVPIVQATSGSSQVGLALLRLYRLSGGEDGGLGGIIVGVTAVELGLSDSWDEALLTTNCSQATSNTIPQCSLVENGTEVQSLFPNGTTFINLMTKTDGEELIVQSKQIDPSTNEFVPSAGWVEIDVTTALNRVLSQQQNADFSSDTTVTFLIYSRSAATFVYDGINEVFFASKEHSTTAWRPQLKVTASGSVNLALSGIASQSQNGNANAAIDGNTDSDTGVASSYAMSRSVDTYPWWQVDLSVIRRIEDIIITIKEKAASTDIEDNQLTAVFWVFLSKTPLSQSGNVTADFLSARKNAVYSRNFSLSRSFNAAETDKALFRWRVNGEPNGQFRDGRFVGNYATPTEARFLRLQVEGQNSVLLNEVEIYQQAFASSRISIGGYIPSVAASGTGQNQINFSLSSENGAKASPCNETTQVCRHELLFTSGNWQSNQQIQVTAIDDNVATGDRQVLITHTAESVESDYRGSSLCNTSAANSPPCNSQLFSESSIKTLQILDDDENKVILSKSAFKVIEGSNAYPYAQPFYRPAKIKARYVRCSSDPSTAIDLQKPSASACAVSFNDNPSTVWETCTSNSSAFPLEKGSAWVMAGFDSEMNISSVSLVLPALTGTKYLRQITLWGNPTGAINDSTTNILDISNGWIQMITLAVSMKSGGPQTVTMSGLSNFTMQSILFAFDKSYDSVNRCIRAPQVFIAGYEPVPFPLPIRGDLTSPDSVPPIASHLSRMHLYGTADRMQIRLSSEPLSDVTVSVLVEDESTDVVTFDATYATTALDTLSELTGAQYESGAIHQYQMPTALRFTAANWNISQELTFLAVDDNTYLGDRSFVMHVNSLSSDADGLIIPVQSIGNFSISRSFVHLSQVISYSAAEFVVRDHQDNAWPYHIVPSWRSAAGAVSVNVVDDDLPGVTISTSEVIVAESSLEAQFAVSLDSAPLQDVTVSISYDKDPTLFTASPLQLTFTRLNWYQPQLVGIYPVPNDGYDGAYPFTLTYERLIPKAKQPILLHQVASADTIYNGIKVGTNENDSSVGYCVNQGVRVVIEDDDTGCAKEYKCVNNGVCQENSKGNVCWCPATYGMKNCSVLCERASECAFDRLAFRIKCLPTDSTAVCGTTFSAKALTSVLYRMLTAKEVTALDGSVYPKLALSSVSEAMYVVNSTTTTCVDGSQGCISVWIDFLRAKLDDHSIANKLSAYQEAGSLQAPPMYIELMTSDPQYKDDLSTMIAMWIFVGFCGAAVTGAGGLLAARAIHAKRSHVTPQDVSEQTELLAPDATSPRGGGAFTSVST